MGHKRIHPEDEYARTYREWQDSVQKNRNSARGRNRETAGDYYERTYRQWRESRRDGSYRQTRRDDGPPPSLPLATRLRMRYATRRWLLFTDAFMVFAAIASIVFFGIRSGPLRNWGKTPRSMTESTGAESVREIYKRNADDAGELDQRKIDRQKLAPNEYLKP